MDPVGQTAAANPTPTVIVITVAKGSPLLILGPIIFLVGLLAIAEWKWKWVSRSAKWVLAKVKGVFASSSEEEATQKNGVAKKSQSKAQASA